MQILSILFWAEEHILELIFGELEDALFKSLVLLQEMHAPFRQPGIPAPGA